METASFNIPSITCSICSGKIRDELNGMDGIENVNVNLKTQMVEVAYEPTEVDPQDIKKRVASMGYEIIQ